LRKAKLSGGRGAADAETGVIAKVGFNPFRHGI